MIDVTPESSSEQVRRYVADALKLDLVGPGGGLGNPEERLKGYERPSNWYLTGFLIPSGTPPELASDPDEDDDLELVPEDAGQPGESMDDKKAAKKAFFPSSMGLSFLIDHQTDSLEVVVRWGDYEFHPAQDESEAEDEVEEEEDHAELEGDTGRPRSYWQRIPREHRVPVQLDRSKEPQHFDVGRRTGLQLHVSEHIIDGSGLELELDEGTRAVSIFVVNHRPFENSRSDRTYAFQAEIEVVCTRGFVPRPNLRGAIASQWDDRLADLHFADSPEYATGHAVSAEWEVHDGICSTIRTAWIPSANVERTVTQEIENLELEMEQLGSISDGETMRAALTPLLDAYSAWISGERLKLDGVTPARREVAEALLHNAEVAQRRLSRGIDLLAQGGDTLEAFQIANRAVARALRQRSRKPEAPKWRSFQLAFILLNLQGIVDPGSSERMCVDLLFFPTGGGKTEAYLGLAAFTMAHRRLTHPEDQGLAGAGVSVIMRYTLRLLTLDQLGRAAGLVCALELEREANVARLGTWPFEIGLWVGKAGTPNLMGERGDQRQDTARSKVIHYKAGKSMSMPIPLDSCPWCGAPFGPDSFQLMPDADKPSNLRIVCSNLDCEFRGNRPLPIVAVDEPIYRRLPAFLISTVDKFASLPWVGASGALLGGARRYDALGFYGAADQGAGRPLSHAILPPDLIIQDELHLISGPLGTMMGLYETMVGALCSGGTVPPSAGPKIVASTATVRRATEQIEALFGRNQTDVFPPPGPSRRDSFFARVAPPSETAARLYLGVAAQGRNPKVVMRRAWLALMGAAQHAYLSAGSGRNDKNPADPYMTILGYFNSLKELGGGRRILEEEVQNTIKGYGSRRRAGEQFSMFANRKSFSEVVELTSRVSTSDVADARRRLSLPFPKEKHKVDCAIATNMISVGLDIQRLGLMVVLGQPKTHSEYIQATSRVGRDEERPGLVVTLLNIHKPRDRSHYERFRHYHETFYRSVEATSVTPFAARAIDRGLPGILVGMARHLIPQMTPPRGAELIEANRASLRTTLLEILFDRIDAMGFTDPDEREERKRSVQDRVNTLLDEWVNVVDTYQQTGTQVQYQKYELATPRPLLRDVLDKSDEHSLFRAGRSLRDVEPEVGIIVREPGYQAGGTA